MSLNLRRTMGAVIDRIYPGLLDESNVNIKAVQLSGSTNSLFVQLDGKTILDSPSLQKFSGIERDFRNEMVTSTGVTISNFGDLARLSTAHQVAFETPTANVFPDAAITRAVFGNQHLNSTKALALGKNLTLDSAKYATILASRLSTKMWCMEKIAEGNSPFPMWDYSHVEASRTDANEVIDAYLKHFKSFVTSICGTPSIGIYLSKDNAVDGNFVPASYNEALTNSGYSFANFDKLCEVPGYQLVWMRFGNYEMNSFGYINLFTYIPGKADTTVINWDVGIIPISNAAWGTCNVRTVSHNRVSQSSKTLKIPRFLSTGNNVSPYADHSATALLNACKRDVAGWTTANATSVMLFGVPRAKFYAQGKYVEQVVEDPEDTRAWKFTMGSFIASEFMWMVDKTWYVDYMEHGYHIFTPRNSNIRENVQKEWRELPYDTIMVRRVEKVVDFKFTVETLPEALKYAKGRAKACKDNDWLKQVAVKDGSMTWGEVSEKEKLARSRLVWGSYGTYDVNIGGTLPYQVNKVVNYTYAGSVLTRKEGTETKQMNLNNEDDQAQFVFDRFYNTGAKITGATWDEVFPLDESEMSYAKNDDFKTSNSVNFDGNPLVGFGAWIDPTGRADVLALNPEQQYRLHIANSISLDRMLVPLTKVFDSFGYQSLVKYLK